MREGDIDREREKKGWQADRPTKRFDRLIPYNS